MPHFWQFRARSSIVLALMTESGTVGQRIIALRGEMTREALARKADISTKTLYRLEHDVGDRPRTSTLRAIADALGQPLGAITGADVDTRIDDLEQRIATVDKAAVKRHFLLERAVRRLADRVAGLQADVEVLDAEAHRQTGASGEPNQGRSRPRRRS